MYYYGNGYPGAPMGGYYPSGPIYQQPNNGAASIWAIVLVIFILFVIIGCGGRGCGFGWGY